MFYQRSERERIAKTPERTSIIIDHSPAYREGLRGFLYDFGFHVTWCHDHFPDDLLAFRSYRLPELLLIGKYPGTPQHHIAEMRRLYPACRIVLLLNAQAQHETGRVIECGPDSAIRRDSSSLVLHQMLGLLFTGITVMPFSLMDIVRASREIQDSAEVTDASIAASPMPDRSPDQTLVGCTGTTDAVAVSVPAQRGILALRESKPRSLSPREVEVLRGLTDGASNKQIARQLAITEATVKVHVRSILRKTGGRNRTQAAMKASTITQTVLRSPGFAD